MHPISKAFSVLEDIHTYIYRKNFLQDKLQNSLTDNPSLFLLLTAVKKIKKLFLSLPGVLVLLPLHSSHTRLRDVQGL